ncbi:MAG: class I SAM-dependent methyltransferase [Phycisphaerales bacterium]
MWTKILDTLGIRRTIVVDGVRYRERTRDPLRRALSRRGTGVKEYDVRFPATAQRKRATMLIRCTNERRFADIGPTRRPTLYDAIENVIRPGMRVFEMGCSTGAGSVRLCEMVGPSGGVVSVDSDRESIRFARLRYVEPQLAFEIGGVETLSGELDGAFDAAILVDALEGDEDATGATLREVWRVIAPGGWMVVFQRVLAPEIDRLTGSLRAACGEDAQIQVGRPMADATVRIAVRRPVGEAVEPKPDDDHDDPWSETPRGGEPDPPA